MIPILLTVYVITVAAVTHEEIDVDMEIITDEDILADVKARNLQEKIFTDGMIITEAAMRGLGLQLLEKFPWGEITLPEVPDSSPSLVLN